MSASPFSFAVGVRLAAVASPLLAAEVPPLSVQSSRQPETGADMTTEAANVDAEVQRKRCWSGTKVEEPATVQDSQLVEDPFTPTTRPVAPSTTPDVPTVTQAVAAEAVSRSSSSEPEKVRRQSVNHCHTPSTWTWVKIRANLRASPNPNPYKPRQGQT